MDQDKIAKDVRQALVKTANRAGIPIAEADLTDSTRPAGPELSLDSESSVGFVCDLEDLGYRINTDENLLVANSRPRTLREIVRVVAGLVAKGT